eukprot:COSAG01_NODE_565_length_15436_cov_64.116581_5_plen_83_part_00
MRTAPTDIPQPSSLETTSPFSSEVSPVARDDASPMETMREEVADELLEPEPEPEPEPEALVGGGPGTNRSAIDGFLFESLYE